MKLNYHDMIKERPFLILILSLFPALALTFNFELAYVVGIIVFGLLFVSTILVSFTKRILPEQFLFPVQVIINGALITLIGILLKDYIPSLYHAFGIYLPLLCLSPILFDRAEFTRKNSFFKSIIDSIKTGFFYFLLLVVIGAIREILGTNMITISDNLSVITGEKLIYRIFTETEFFPASFFTHPSGAFLILGLIIACEGWLQRRKKNGTR